LKTSVALQSFLLGVFTSVLCNLRSSTVLVACMALLCNNPEHLTLEDLNDFQFVHSNF